MSSTKHGGELIAGIVAGHWKGTFRFVEDCQCVNSSLACSDFMLTLHGEWWPIDWDRFRTTHPEEWKQIHDIVVKRRGAEKYVGY